MPQFAARDLLSRKAFSTTAVFAALLLCSGGAVRGATIPRNWRFKTDPVNTCTVSSSPALATDGTVYVGVNITTSVGDGRVLAINPNGSTKWSCEVPTDWVESSPAVGSDGTVYAGSWDGNLYAINPTNGVVKWQFATGLYIYGSPAVGPDGIIYVGAGDFTLHAILPSGVEAWHWLGTSLIASSPAIGVDGSVYFGSSDKNIYGLRSDGTLKWQVATGDTVLSSPAIGSDGTVYCGSSDGLLYALAPADGTVRWTYSTGGAIDAAPVLGANGTIYVGSVDGYFYALNPDGTLLWRTNVGWQITSTAAVRADGSVVFGAYDNKIHALNASGTENWNYAFGTLNDAVDSSPVVAADGTIYVGSMDGYLYSLKDTVAPLSTGYWPMFHQGPQHTGLAIAPPAFTTQPQGQSVVVGTTVTFTALASGNPPPTFQWKKGGTVIAGATSATLTLSNVQLADAATYTVVATNFVTSTTSSGAVLTVSAASTAPVITTPPQSQTAVVGATVTFTAAASGTPTPTLQWKKGSTAIAGATGASLVLTGVQVADAGSYTVVATNLLGSATSSAAVLTVNAPPAFTTQPQSQAAVVGTSVTFTVVASGTPTPTLQWQKGGTAIAGANGATLTLNNVQLADAATYTVVATNAVSSTTSSAAVLTVSATQIAPAITTQPLSQTAVVGDTVTFTASASGTPTPTFQWQKSGTAIAGAGATLTLNNVQLTDAGSYTVVATNLAGTATSSAAVLTVNSPPAFTTQPQSLTVLVGANVTFTAAASGTPAPTYQWRKSGIDLAGQTSATLTLTNVQPTDADTYYVVATNAVTSTASNYATLTVNTAPAIATQPQSQTVVVGASVTFTADVTGSPTPTFQWRKGGIDITGATSATLTLTNAQFTDAASYIIVATNTLGTATSSAAVLTVNPAPPTITAQPQDCTIATGSTVVFSVAATGTGLTYQWAKDGVNLTGATAASFLLANAQSTDAGNYAVAVGNGTVSTATSNPAALTVLTTTTPGRLINLSTRGQVGTGGNVLIAGFVITGSAAKPVIIRGVGPTLTNYGVTGTLPDPLLTLQLTKDGSVVSQNDNWATAGTPATVIADMARVGAFALPTGSLDSVISTTLAPGTYTATLSGNGATNTGVGIVEIYDATVTLDNTSPRLVNISTRGVVGTGASVMIPGFVITGATAKTVLIRCVGPTLANYGVTGTLADPIIYLNDSHGTVINQNDNWGTAGDAALITSAAATTGAFALAPGSKDSALLVTLPPGSYTVTVNGVNATTGVALVEVYELP